MRVSKFNEEVLFTDQEIVKVGPKDIEFLKQKAKDNERKRIRLCLHKDVGDKLHEMLIIHTKDTYVRPHKHLNKSESLYVIEGAADAVIFDEAGNVTEVIQMGDYSSGRMFYYRISQPIYHCLIITTDFFVFHEVTDGPFKKSDTIFPLWSPDETDGVAVKGFMNRLSQSAVSFLSRR